MSSNNYLTEYWLNLFPRVTITKHQKLDGLKQQKCTLSHSGGQKSEIQVLAGSCSLQSL